MARPTKYDKKYIQSVKTYLSKHTDKYSVQERSLTVKLPTVEGFAFYIGVNKTTLYEWEKQHNEFSNALESIRQEQKERLINSGLSGQYNPTIAKLILASNHGMSDRAVLTTEDETGKTLPITGMTITADHE